MALNKIVISIQAAPLDRVLCLAYSDGSIEYRDRASLAESFTEGNMEKFSHISQVGFSFTNDEPSKFQESGTVTILRHHLLGLQIAFSPNHSSLVQIGSDNRLKWRTLRHRLDQGGTEFERGKENSKIDTSN